MYVPTIFSRFLAALGIPHTDMYSDGEFRNMTFKSLYGLSHLLSEYGIKNKAVKFTDKQAITKLSTPFLAQTSAGIFVIVTQLDPQSNIVEYDSRGKHLQIDLDSFIKAWNGIALLAFPTTASKEPDYTSHRITELVTIISKYALYVTSVGVFCYLLAYSHAYAQASTLLLVLFNCLGLYLSYMLVQKSLNIHTVISDSVCGVLEHGGCDSIVKLKVSKLFGVFSWSEIGFGYFGVSLAVLLLFPHFIPALAICNLCCLPYTFWSIWYQKFRAHHWCTLCVGVQSTLWLLFFCYLGGGWLMQAFPLHGNVLILIDFYVFAVLLINVIIRTLKNLIDHEQDS